MSRPKVAKPHRFQRLWGATVHHPAIERRHSSIRFVFSSSKERIVLRNSKSTRSGIKNPQAPIGGRVGSQPGLKLRGDARLPDCGAQRCC